MAETDINPCPGCGFDPRDESGPPTCETCGRTRLVVATPRPPMTENYAVGVARLDGLELGKELTLQLPAGAQIVHCHVALEPASVMLRTGPPRFVEIPILTIVCDPKREIRPRRLVAIAAGLGVTSPNLMHPVATVQLDGRAVVLFQVDGCLECSQGDWSTQQSCQRCKTEAVRP